MSVRRLHPPPAALRRTGLRRIRDNRAGARVDPSVGKTMMVLGQGLMERFLPEYQEWLDAPAPPAAARDDRA